MSRSKEVKNKIKQKLEVIKKINDDPKQATDDLYDLYLKDLPSTDKLFGKKFGDFLDKRKKKKENNKDIFGEIIDLTESFLGTNKKVTDTEKLQSKTKLRRYAKESSKVTIDNLKQIFLEEVKKIFFAADGICGTNSVFKIDNLTISPKEIDFLNMLTVDPSSNIGQIIYEPTANVSLNKQKTNRELYNAFGGTQYDFDTVDNNTLFSALWSAPNQHYQISGLLQGSSFAVSVENFLNDYYSNIELPDISGITKNAMLLTLNGGEGTNPLFDKSFNDLNRFLDKLFTICGSPQKKNELKSDAVEQFNENDEDIEFYFNFDDVEGIDIDAEDARFRKVLKFTDCDNFEIPIEKRNIEDFVYLSKTKNLDDVVDDTLGRIGKIAYDKSKGNIPSINFNVSLLGAFIKALPKAIIMAILSPKMILPIVIVYKVFKSMVLNEIKTIMQKLRKLFSSIIKRLFWLFIREFWRRVKGDLLEFVSKIAAKILRNKRKRYLTIIKSLINFLKTLLESKIDNCYDIFTTIINTVNAALAGGISTSIPALLLAFSNRSPGYSTDRAFMNISERLQKAGVEIGPIYGESNKLLSVIKSVVEGHTEEEDTNGFIAAGNQFFTFPVPGLSGPVTIPPGVIRIFGKKR